MHDKRDRRFAARSFIVVADIAEHEIHPVGVAQMIGDLRRVGVVCRARPARRQGKRRLRRELSEICPCDASVFSLKRMFPPLLMRFFVFVFVGQ